MGRVSRESLPVVGGFWNVATMIQTGVWHRRPKHFSSRLGLMRASLAPAWLLCSSVATAGLSRATCKLGSAVDISACTGMGVSVHVCMHATYFHRVLSTFEVGLMCLAGAPMPC